MSEKDLEARRSVLVAADALGLECLLDNDGQIVIYTGLALPDGKQTGTFRDAVPWSDPADAERCDECGASYPAAATTLQGPWHDESCSLHEAAITP